MSEITNIDQFKQDIECCREVRIFRPWGYYHHVFVGDVDKNGCDIYHYASSLFFKGFPPAKIIKVRLHYETYDTCSEILAIFNFKKGDTVEIVNRPDYPKTEEDHKRCIEKAISRVGEMLYTASFNNCESYVNWIFSNDNSSKQASNKFFLSLCVDELNLSKMFAFLLRDLPIIARKITGWIGKMLGKLDTFLTSKLEKYWNQFAEKIENIINNLIKPLQSPDSFLGKAVRWVRDNPWIRDALVTTNRLRKIYYSDFLTGEQKARNICRILGSYIFGVIGERFPLPGICGYIGNVVGAIVGEVVFSVGKYILSWF